MGKPIQQFNKNSPDTYYENSADRWFTTTGVEKAQTTRSKNILRPENRSTTTREYFGNGKDRESSGTYQPGHFRKTHKTQLGAPGLGIATQSDNWGATNKDYGKQGFKLLPNSRSLNENRIDLGPVGAAVNALTAPILDFLRPSRKENVIGNMRPMGNVTGRYGVNKKSELKDDGASLKPIKTGVTDKGLVDKLNDKLRDNFEFDFCFVC